MKLLLLNRYYRGGQTTHTHALADAVAALGHDVTLGYVQPWLPRELLLAAPRHVSISKTPTFASALDLCRTSVPCLIHAHSQHTWSLARALAGELQIPYVITAHRVGLAIPPFLPALRSASAVIVPGPKTAESLADAAIPSSRIISNGIDVKVFRPGEKRDRPCIGYVGRVDSTRPHGFNAFLRATEGLDADVAFLGCAPKGVVLPAHVRALGWRADVAPILAQMDVVVGVGRSLLEGLACGAAGIVLGTGCHGLVSPETVAPLVATDRSWTLSSLEAVTAGEEIETLLRNAFHHLLQSRNRLRELQAFARSLVCRHFDMHARAKEIESIYAEAIATPRPARPRPVPRPTENGVSAADDSLASLVERIERQRIVVDGGLKKPARWHGALRHGDRDGEGRKERLRRVATTFNWLVSLVESGRPPPIDAALARRIHDKAVGGADYRQHGVRIARYRDFALPARISSLVESLLTRIARSQEPAPLRAARLHLEFVLIHPFADGNGRTARLLSSYLLLQAGYRSTLLTAVEQHFAERYWDYIPIMSRLRPGSINSECLRRTLEAMGNHSRFVVWFRERERRLRKICVAAGVTGARQDRELLRFDLGENTTVLSTTLESPWTAIRETWDWHGREALRLQLGHLRREERSRRNIGRSNRI
jgi:glycosyltransferase involved in cell wall biosynthesis